ncbi:MAG: hypothetical protein ACP5NV_05300 [Candidatus Woesearchaeota archaeon]
MRIQEHLFHGFFGNKTKKDSAKYYTERVDKLKGLDNDLDKTIEQFQKILLNHKEKIVAYDEFLKKFDSEKFLKVKEEVMKLEGMFDEDELANESERRYIVRMENILSELIKNEENVELSQAQKDTVQDLKELLRMIEHIKPLWETQISFMKAHDYKDINKDAIKELTDIFKRESETLKIEETLLKKIDLKTGNILRKTTLKLRDLEKTKDMNMTYREIRHIR